MSEKSFEDQLNEIIKLAGVEKVSEGIFTRRPIDSVNILIKDIEQSMTQLTSINATYAEIDARDVRKILEAVVNRLERLK